MIAIPCNHPGFQRDDEHPMRSALRIPVSALNIWTLQGSVRCFHSRDSAAPLAPAAVEPLRLLAPPVVRLQAFAALGFTRGRSCRGALSFCWLDCRHSRCLALSPPAVRRPLVLECGQHGDHPARHATPCAPVCAPFPRPAPKRLPPPSPGATWANVGVPSVRPAHSVAPHQRPKGLSPLPRNPPPHTYLPPATDAARCAPGCLRGGMARPVLPGGRSGTTWAKRVDRSVGWPVDGD